MYCKETFHVFAQFIKIYGSFSFPLNGVALLNLMIRDERINLKVGKCFANAYFFTREVLTTYSLVKIKFSFLPNCSTTYLMKNSLLKYLKKSINYFLITQSHLLSLVKALLQVELLVHLCSVACLP
jgi:hypothetical protein